MPSQKRSAAAPPPPPPRPDPVTLDHIYDRLTRQDVAMEERAYYLVALSTVAFHPSVKLFFFERTPVHPAAAGGEAEAALVAEANTRRREAVLRGIAFFLAQRNSAVVRECRWETVALLGELCRLESLTPLRPGGHAKAALGATSALSPQQEVVEKVNRYARANLEFLARLPWFVPAVQELIGAEPAEGGAAAPPSSSSAAAAAAAPVAVRRAARQRGAGDSNATTTTITGDDGDDAAGVRETDEDVRIALKDLLAALPEVRREDGAAGASVVWSAASVDQAHDLMFLDASTTMLHLIPLVTRSSHRQCAHCEKRAAAASDGGGDGGALLRCGSCKAVYYCDAACQRAHWAAAHRVPCRSYKQQAEDIMAQYAAMNKWPHGGSRRKAQQQQEAAVAVLEVPLEPSLFYETRRYLYDHRDSSFAEVSFMDYFMKYTVRGN
ncbi:MYND zinc finger (ZnF) domain-like protein [Trypanosoma conorhini]|uniref:MYND zinc finger (ZnF) domain-like protein n=1 Tax=Trypanosoma conorhini TaxID=83891 RepID=A0A422PEM3_9TRYP|nr:MYND zinc finger (ZnF) domain-like protein [Trypanosoma conorhini]RNF16133.1 MYND zinc finger (ZnF) domain-like protein [Trypanosoma conorhini]